MRQPQYKYSLNSIYCPHWLVQWSPHCSHMHIPVHSPWLPDYINVVQTILIILTMVGLFSDRPHKPRSGNSGSHGNSMCNFWRSHHTFSIEAGPILHCPPAIRKNSDHLAFRWSSNLCLSEVASKRECYLHTGA